MKPFAIAAWFSSGVVLKLPTSYDAAEPFPLEARTRISDAMQMTKHVTLTSKRFRFVKLIAMNKVLAMFRCTNPPHNRVSHPM
jgi:hypothetical protein